MTDSSDNLTVGQSLQNLGLDADPFLSANHARNWWYFEVFGTRIYCYNFKWRRKALAFHDLHHVVTGYPCTLRGEMQVATWEFAAGSYPSFFAKMFCLPLVAIGAVLIPKKIFAAYENGTRSKSLFHLNLDSSVAIMPTVSLRELASSPIRNHSASAIIVGYLALVSASALTYILPLMTLLWLVWNSQS